ncbi:hypothetical protein A1D29_06635 [Pasteurellaceae bacterium Orientalotternb1]|nr:hypothetical protein A1D29_06635 [Pasteurellaceae bacterium Orientalotternb1]
MYTLILRCRDAVKKGSVSHRFRKWVTAEVLPQIRKTGSYQRKTTVDDRTGLRDAVNMLVSKRGLIYSEAYQMVYQRFNVQSIEDLSKEQLPMAVEYVHKICLEGELIIQDPKPTNAYPMSEDELQDLAWCWFALERCTETLRLIYQPLQLLGSSFAPTDIVKMWNIAILFNKPIKS